VKVDLPVGVAHRWICICINPYATWNIAVSTSYKDRTHNETHLPALCAGFSYAVPLTANERLLHVVAQLGVSVEDGLLRCRVFVMRGLVSRLRHVCHEAVVASSAAAIAIVE
jgi:hypothetical protein